MSLSESINLIRSHRSLHHWSICFFPKPTMFSSVVISDFHLSCQLSPERVRYTKRVDKLLETVNYDLNVSHLTIAHQELNGQIPNLLKRTSAIDVNLLSTQYWSWWFYIVKLCATHTISNLTELALRWMSVLRFESVRLGQQDWVLTIWSTYFDEIHWMLSETP